MEQTKNNSMNIATALSKRRGELWILLFEREYNLSDLGKMVGLRPSSVYDHLEILEKAKLVKYRYESEEGKKGVNKIYTPSFRGVYEQFAKARRKQLAERDYQIIDDFLLHPNIKSEFFKGAKAGIKTKDVDPIIRISLVVSEIITGYTKAIKIKGDKEFERKKKAFLSVMKKLL